MEWKIRFWLQPLELISVRESDKTPVQITLRLVGEIQKEDATYTNVSNT